MLQQHRRQIRWPDKTDYETVIGFYQILNQGNGNLWNQSKAGSSPRVQNHPALQTRLAALEARRGNP
jgi:hypothetical protein